MFCLTTDTCCSDVIQCIRRDTLQRFFQLSSIVVFFYTCRLQHLYMMFELTTESVTWLCTGGCGKNKDVVHTEGI